MEGIKPVFLKVNPDLWHLAKLQAVKEKKSLREFVIEAIQDKLHKETDK